jgi:hypothetical protein
MPHGDWQEVRKREDRRLEGSSPALVSAWGPMVGGVVAAATVIALICPPLRPQSLSRGRLILIAIGLLLVAVFISWVGARMIDAFLSRRASSGVVRGAWVGALWVPAWILCLEAPSVMTVLAGCFCMVSLSRSIKLYDLEAATPVDGAVSGLPSVVFQFDWKALARVLLPSLALSLLAQAAIAAIALNRYELASILAGIAVAALVWQGSARASGTLAVRTGISNSRAIRASVLAFVFTAIVLLPYLRIEVFPGGVIALLKRGDDVDQPKIKMPEESSVANNDGYTGIILLPLIEPHKKIVAPHREDPALALGRPREPVVIPFNGAYWYFKAPDKRPRLNARVVHGSSTKAVISSTDRYPLLMEAHQRLDVSIDLNCCSQIDIGVQNADRRDGSISLELWVKNKVLPGQPSYYLGTAVIPSSESRQKPTVDAAKIPVEETLGFPVPTAMEGIRFDEIMVIVRPAPERARMGAQIAIRQFVLRP